MADQRRPIPGRRKPKPGLDGPRKGLCAIARKALIIKHADKIGATMITLEVAHEGIEQAKATWRKP